MKLDTTTRKLEVLLAGTVSTTACPVVVCYRDENRNAPQNLGAVPSATQAITVSSVTVSTFLSAPSVNTIVRVPERISFKNSDVSTHTVTFRLNDNSTTYPFWSPQLLTGESAFYDEGRGWYATDAQGNLKEALAAASNWAVSGNLTVAGNTTLGDAAADSLTINAGIATAPNIPSFLVQPTSTATNATGDGTSVSPVVFDTEIRDQGSNFASNTYTAPYAGPHDFSVILVFTGVTNLDTNVSIDITTSNRGYPVVRQSGIAVGATAFIIPGTIVGADMDAGDTAIVACSVGGSTKTVSINNGSYFSGKLSIL